jgi:hypothetical protein
MTIQDLGSLGEFFGSIAVLATLVYLALQTRQNTQAIGAQLDAAAIAANQNFFLSIATSNELQEALAEDNTAGVTANEMRLRNCWVSFISYIQWQHHQARRGLLPSFHEAGMAVVVSGLFTASRGFEGWWEGVKSIQPPEFVAWVEEQREKAA